MAEKDEESITSAKLERLLTKLIKPCSFNEKHRDKIRNNQKHAL